MTEQELQVIKERAEKATAGAWKVVKSEESGVQIGTTWEHAQLKGCVPVITTAVGVDGTTIYINHDNAEFIAHAREDVPALVAEVERLKHELETTQKHLETTERHLRDFRKFEFEERTEKEKLREALQNYAVAENYERVANEPDVLENGMTMPTWEPSWIEFDKGETARKALEG